MVDYSKLSDQLLNVAILEVLGVKYDMYQGKCLANMIKTHDNVITIQGVNDFCSDWSLTGKLITDNNISVISSSEDSWVAMVGDDMKTRSVSKNPLRAAVVALLRSVKE